MRTEGTTRSTHDTRSTQTVVHRLAEVWADIVHAQKRYVALNGPVVTSRRTHA